MVFNEIIESRRDIKEPIKIFCKSLLIIKEEDADRIIESTKEFLGFL